MIANMNCSEIINLVLHEMSDTKLGICLIERGWKLKPIYGGRRFLGSCSWKKRKGIFYKKNIELNMNLLKLCSDEIIRNTILHEIAHALDVEDRGFSNHDQAWKIICIKIGCRLSTPSIDIGNAYQEYIKSLKTSWMMIDSETGESIKYYPRKRKHFNDRMTYFYTINNQRRSVQFKKCYA